MKQLLILALLFAIASAFTEVEYQNEFTNWMRKLTKAYTSKDFQSRYNIFKTNLDFITRWNQENTDTVLGENELADLSNDEYRRFYLGYRPTQNERLRATSFSGWSWPTPAPTTKPSSSGTATGWTWPTAAPTTKPTTAPTTPTTAPTTAPTTPPTTPTTGTTAAASLNWATLGAVTPVKNQGQCGSCWSFSATGAMEGAYFIKTGKLVSLSEQNLIDCSKSLGNNGCNGGSMGLAFKYVVNNKGIDTGASYPYKGTDTGACQYNAANLGATITSYKNVASGSESALLTAVNLGPVSVAIDASRQSFQLYKTGVYYEAACSSTALDHGVLLVGYGTSGSSDYWIVKNSWGTGWGQAGYVWMSRNRNNNCGIATSAVYPVA